MGGKTVDEEAEWSDARLCVDVAGGHVEKSKDAARKSTRRTICRKYRITTTPMGVSAHRSCLCSKGKRRKIKIPSATIFHVTDGGGGWGM